MRKTYGNTWWGKQWLNALKGIDNSNRLPRGRTYANKGAVADIQLMGQKIRAEVHGSRVKPYQVELNFSRFSQQEQATIVELITENPLLLSQLLNREMPKTLFDLCEAAGISLFPAAWDDLDGACSCPDWAVPCKHLAAVLYVVANEIDQNPFLIFELHDFDLIQALESSQLEVVVNQEITVRPVDTLMEPLANDDEHIEPTEQQTDSAIDFSVLADLQLDLPALLSDQPSFYPEGDFKKLLGTVYGKLQKQARKSLDHPQFAEFSPVWSLVEDIEILLDQDLDYLTTTIRDESGESLLHLDTITKLTAWLDQIAPYDDHQLSTNLKGLLLSYRLAKHLVAAAAFVPQIVTTTDHSFRIRWLPAFLNDQVKTVCKQVANFSPESILFYRSGKRFLQPTSEDAFSALISLWLGEMVRSGHQQSFHRLLEKVPALFLQGTIQQFTSFSEQSIPGAIQLWLNQFFLSEKKYVPILQVEDAGGEGFAVTILIEDRDQTLPVPVSLSDMFTEDLFRDMRLSILRDLALLTNYFPQIGEVVAAKGQKVLLFDPQAFVPVLFKLLPSIQLLGVKVLLPKALRKLSQPRLSLSLDRQGNTQPSGKSRHLGLQNMLAFEWQIAIGDQPVSVAEFQDLTAQYQGIVRLNDEYIYFDEREIHQLIHQLTNDPPDLSPAQLVQAALTESYGEAGIAISPEARQVIRELLNTPAIAAPAGLLATLRPYQQRGYEWMYKNAQLGYGSLLADDMGLGKTLQVIAILLRLQQDGRLDHQKALIVVPTTLLTNWEKELQRFAPTLTWYTYHGSNRTIQGLEDKALCLTTYGVVRTAWKKLQQQDWVAVVIDEAQQIKNPATAQTKAIKQLAAPIRIAMSGTPVENRLSEYWSVLDFVNQGYLGSLKSFVSQFAKPIEVDRNQERMAYFRTITAPFIMRRLKSDKTIIQDLPEKIEKDQFCTLTSSQAALYQSFLADTMERIETTEGITRKGLVLKLLTGLKQICNHPHQFLKRGKRITELSGKCLRLIPLLTEILANGGKVLIFTQYQAMGKLLQYIIKKELQIECSFLHGGVTRKRRDEMVKNFQTMRTNRLLILSLKAAGTGLNLTAANHVVHYDLWWNPAVEAQATDRAFRIGQQRNVMVHRLITEHTFEEKIDQMLKEKQALADQTVVQGEQWIGDLSNRELHNLVKI